MEGVYGNTHLMMPDDNSAEIAAAIIAKRYVVVTPRPTIARDRTVATAQTSNDRGARRRVSRRRSTSARESSQPEGTKFSRR